MNMNGKTVLNTTTIKYRNFPLGSDLLNSILNCSALGCFEMKDYSQSQNFADAAHSAQLLELVRGDRLSVCPALDTNLSYLYQPRHFL